MRQNECQWLSLHDVQLHHHSSNQKKGHHHKNLLLGWMEERHQVCSGRTMICGSSSPFLLLSWGWCLGNLTWLTSATSRQGRVHWLCSGRTVLQLRQLQESAVEQTPTSKASEKKMMDHLSSQWWMIWWISTIIRSVLLDSNLHMQKKKSIVIN